MYMILGMLFACQETSSTETPVEKTPTTQTTKKTAEETPAKEGMSESNALDPKIAVQKAPDQYEVLLETSQGNVVIEVTREWAPLGADRFYNLVQMGYFTDIAFFRAIKGFMVQFGIHGEPKVAAMWRNARIKDDAVTQSNLRGMITFATSGPNSRTTQLFINVNDNANLDAMGFSPFGKVSETKGGGIQVIDSLFMEYGEGAPRGRGPNQGLIQQKGNAYLKESFPKLDYIKSARICNGDC